MAYAIICVNAIVVRNHPLTTLLRCKSSYWINSGALSCTRLCALSGALMRRSLSSRSRASAQLMRRERLGWLDSGPESEFQSTAVRREPHSPSTSPGLRRRGLACELTAWAAPHLEESRSDQEYERSGTQISSQPASHVKMGIRKCSSARIAMLQCELQISRPYLDSQWTQRLSPLVLSSIQSSTASTSPRSSPAAWHCSRSWRTKAVFLASICRSERNCFDFSMRAATSARESSKARLRSVSRS